MRVSQPCLTMDVRPMTASVAALPSQSEIRAGVYAFFRLELAEGGGLPTAEVLSVARTLKPDDLPAFGRCREGHRIRRLRRLSGRPAAMEEIWLDGGWAEALAPSDLSESLYLFYRQALNLWIARAEDSVGLGPVPEWRAPEFGLAAGAPCGFIERWGKTPEGEVAEYSRTWFDPGVARYVARIR